MVEQTKQDLNILFSPTLITKYILLTKDLPTKISSRFLKCNRLSNSLINRLSNILSNKISNMLINMISNTISYLISSSLVNA